MKGQYILAFHTGRGGRFNNAGYKTFKGFKAIDRFVDDLFMNNDEIEYIDGNGNSIGLLVDNDGTGSIDIDGDFDTIVCKRLDDLLDEEMDAVLRDNDFRKVEVLEYYVRNVNEWYEYDLFEYQEYLPKKVADIIEYYQDKYHMVSNYEICEKLMIDLEKVGFTCDYGLDGIPIDLRFKI